MFVDVNGRSTSGASMVGRLPRLSPMERRNKDMPRHSSSYHRLADRLAESRASMFVGRAGVLVDFRAVVTADAPRVRTAVIFIHGPGGVGKSTVLQRFADMAREAGRRVAHVNARDMEPSRQAFEANAGVVLDDPAGVLIVDNFERCQELESWLADELLPQLPVGALVVLASRNPPGARWCEDLGWAGALHVVSLENLTRVEARELLDRMRVKPDLHDGLIGATRGHPLALRLAAEAAKHGDVSTLAWNPDQAILRKLVERLVGDAPSPSHRRALEVCAHTLATTEGTLRAVVGEEAPRLFDWLRRQPYIESGKYGLVPHDLVRDIIEADFRWRDPSGYQQVHDEISRYVIEEAHNPTGSDILPATFTWTYLLRHHGFLSRFLTWDVDAEIYEDTFREPDRVKILRLIELVEGSRSADIAESWLNFQPEAFRVVRAVSSGEPIGVLAWLRLTPDMADMISQDPLTAAAWEHLESHQPLRAGEGFSVARYLVASDAVRQPAGANAYSQPSAAKDLMIHRCLAEVARSKTIAWSFFVLVAGSFWVEFMESLNFLEVPKEIPVGERDCVLYALNWKRRPFKRWMELGTSIEPAGPVKRRPGLHGDIEETVVLSRSEFDKAVVDALDSLHRRDRLAANPLARTRMVTDHADEDPVASLRALIADSLAAVGEDPRAEKYYRAVQTRYVRGAPTREAAAERLGVSLSTFQRHLAQGLKHVRDQLWDRELG
jgi:hypothetical protein